MNSYTFINMHVPHSGQILSEKTLAFKSICIIFKIYNKEKT